MSSKLGLPSLAATRRRIRVAALLGAALALLAVSAVGPPQPAKAHLVPGPVQVGTSFSPRRAAQLGLDWKAAYRHVLDMHFRVIRLSAYWDEIDQSGHADLDWLLAASEQAGQPVLVTVGMKGLGWPEFYIPEALKPPPGERDGGDVTADNPELRAAALRFVAASVRRYRGNRALVAWQVENEPLNRAGPQRWWIGLDFLGQELAAVRALDSRPVVLNVFSHFNRNLDAASSRHGFDLRQLLGFEVDTAEQETLGALARGDILGLDVYTRIGYRAFGTSQVSTANPDWDEHAGHWRARALDRGLEAWVTEAQAEPWEAEKSTAMTPRSFGPADIQTTFDGLRDAGYTTVLLWGVEYWLAQAQAGNPAWLDAGTAILAAEQGARPLPLAASNPGRATT